MVEVATLRVPAHELEALGHTAMRSLIAMSPVPGAVALLVSPVRDQPELVRRLDRRDDIHAYEFRCLVDPVGSRLKSLLHVLLHLIGDNKTTQGDRI